MKKTKIIATVGPVTQSKEQLKNLYDAGVNVIRFNFSHANYEISAMIANNIKQLNSEGSTNLSLMLDTKGPEIRTGKLENKIQYNSGDLFKIVVDPVCVLEGNMLFCDYEYLLEDINVGDIIRIDSGLFDAKVIEVASDHLVVQAMNDALIGSTRHVNLPGLKLRLPGISEKDKQDILFAIENGFDFIAASFIRTKENLFEIKEFLKENNASHIKIISKIENQESIENLDEIIEHSDGIMVARGDLGIEVPIAMLPIYQKKIVKKCKEHGKIVIVATHFLETMIENPYPTRAEISDIFNSVWQKVDAIMLSGETSVGKYPIKCVEFMKSVIDQAEKTITYQHDDFLDSGLTQNDLEKKVLIHSAINIGEKLNAKAILVFSKSGLLARFASCFRPNITTYCFTNKKSSLYYMNLLFGIIPFYLDFVEYPGDTLEISINFLVEKGVLSKDDKIIAVTDINKSGIEIPVIEIIHVGSFL